MTIVVCEDKKMAKDPEKASHTIKVFELFNNNEAIVT